MTTPKAPMHNHYAIAITHFKEASYMSHSTKNRIFILILLLISCNAHHALGQLGAPSELSTKSRSSIANIEKQIDTIAKSLMMAVYDTSYSGEERIEFVVILGEIGTEACIDFLIKNLNYQIYHPTVMGETGLAQVQIFNIVLSERVKNKWSVIHGIQRALQSGIAFDEKMLIKLSLVLTTSCDRNIDTVTSILKSSYDGQYSTKKNIDEMLLMILGHK